MKIKTNDTSGRLCKKFAGQVWLLIDHSLSAEKMEKWQAHLQKCGDCRMVLQQAEGTIRSFRRAADTEIDAFDYERMVHKAVQHPQDGWATRNRPWVWAAAAVLLVMVSSFGILHNSTMPWNSHGDPTVALLRQQEQSDADLAAIDLYDFGGATIDSLLLVTQDTFTELENQLDSQNQIGSFF